MADISADFLLPSGDSGVTLSGSQPYSFGSSSGNSGVGFSVSPAVNISSALTTVLSLTGRRLTSYILLQGIDATPGSLSVQLLVDGAIVLYQTEPSSTRNTTLIITASLTPMIKSNSSIELKAQKSGSTSVQALYCSVVVI